MIKIQIQIKKSLNYSLLKFATTYKNIPTYLSDLSLSSSIDVSTPKYQSIPNALNESLNKSMSLPLLIVFVTFFTTWVIE